VSRLERLRDFAASRQMAALERCESYDRGGLANPLERELARELFDVWCLISALSEELAAGPAPDPMARQEGMSRPGASLSAMGEDMARAVNERLGLARRRRKAPWDPK